MKRRYGVLRVLILAAAATGGAGSCQEVAPVDESVATRPPVDDVVTVQAAVTTGNNAAFVSQSVPTSMYAGQVKGVTVTMKNTGTSVWKAGVHRLGSQNPANNQTWGLGRVDLNSINPGETKPFNFNITAPSTPGTYTFQWRMVQENVEWFGAQTPIVTINVLNNAAVDQQVVLARMYADVPVIVSITMRNTGDTIWTASGNYRLGSRNPQDNQTWGFGRVDLLGGDSIGPGQQKTFTFTVRPPSTPGTYNFQWQMLQEGFQWFGAATSNVAVSVVNAPPVDTGPAATTPSTPRPRPAHVECEMGGNGHSETWDGRVFFRTGGSGWTVGMIRPESISDDGTGRPNFHDAADRPGFTFDIDDGAPAVTGMLAHNSLALTPWPGRIGANPFRASGTDCSASDNGVYECYDLAVITDNEDSPLLLGRRHAMVVVENPRTTSAKVKRAWFVDDPIKMVPLNGGTIKGHEPTITFDGRLLIYNNGDKLYYTFNNNPADVNNWSTPEPIANMYQKEVTSGTMVGPVNNQRHFEERFPVALKPLRSADGQIYTRDQQMKGAYPWISHDGTELFYQTATAGTPGDNRATRGATSVVGRWTNWVARHIDGPSNPNRDKLVRLFTSSPGAIPSFWSAWRDARPTLVPYTRHRPVFPLIGSNTEDYNEISFEVGADGDYVVALDMNELVKKDRTSGTNGDFDLFKTPDTSGRINNGIVEGASFPTEYEHINEQSLNPPETSILRGAAGQALYFPDAGQVRVPLASELNEVDSAMTAQLFVQRVIDLGRDDGLNLYRFLAYQPGSWNIILEETGRIQVTVYTANGMRRTGEVGDPLPVGQWVHVAFTYDGASGTLTVYRDGDQVYRQVLGGASIVPTSQDLFIGPGGRTTAAPFVASQQAVLMLDDFRLSRVVRSRADMLHAAYREIPWTPASPPALPAGLDARDLKIAADQATTPDQVNLGKMLFFDPRLSSNGTKSCASCHNPAQAFTDGLKTARGINNVTLPRNTPTIFNRAMSTVQFLDGRALSLEDQAVAPLNNPLEMGIGVDGAVSFLKANPGYAYLFFRAFGPGDPTAANIGRALAAFQRSVFSGASPFDTVTPSPTSDEAKGFLIFKTKGRCIACHNGSNFTDEAFHETALATDGDIGRKAVTGRTRDLHAFKTPSLRNVALTAPYFHDGSVLTLEDVVTKYANAPVSGTSTSPDFEMRPLDLTGAEKAQLVAFLRSLSGPATTITAPPLP